MEKHEVTKWLIVMKASLNSFPEVSKAKKIEALREAIRLLKNEQSIDKVDCDHTECRNCINHKYCDYESSSSEIPNKSIEEKCPCYDCEYFVIDGLSHCKIYEGAYGDCRCKNYHKVNQDLTKVKQDLTKVKQGSNRSEIPTGSDDCISREQALDLLCKKCPVYDCIRKCVSYKAIEKMSSVTLIRPKGHWFVDERPESDREIICSNCEQPIFKYHKMDFDYRPNYCPNCGADMRGEEE